MKRIILLLFIIGFMVNVSGYDKKSLVERFTNASCAPCASLNSAWYNATTASMLQSGTISHIIYNVWWPGANDPMYILNQPDNTTRTNYYGVNSVPWIVVNGTTVSTTQTAFTNAVNTGNSQFSPFKIVMTQRALSDNLIEVGVKIFRDPADVTTFGTTKLKVALTEKQVVFATAPGTNGETHFYSVTRKMLPDASGTTLTIPAPGDSLEVILQYVPSAAFLQSVNMDSLRVVAFIQNETNKSIYQSEMFEMIPNYVAEINSGSADIIADNTTPAQFNAVIKNIGMMSDTYTVGCSLNGPTGWTGVFNPGTGNIPFGTSGSVEVAPGDSAIIQLTVNPSGINGFGQSTVEFTSTNNPGMAGTVTLNNVTVTGNNLLVISAGDREYESFVTNSLPNVYSGTFGAVSRSALQSSSVSLEPFDIVIWQGGNSTRAFYQEEVDKLEQYLNNGGNLLITGQNIGRDIFESNGQSQFAQDFYHNYLHTNYVADISNLFIIKGVSGDVISNGIQFIANTIYSRSLDKITARDANAVNFLTYFNGPDVAGVRSAFNNYRVIYTTAGLEQITEQPIRDTLLSRSLNWLSENVIPPDIQVISYETHIDSTLGSEMVFDFKVVNVSQTQQSVFEVRTLNNLPNGWTSSLCFDSTCFSPSLDSVVTEPPFGEPLNPGDTLVTSLHITALNNEGTANVQIQIGTLHNPADRITLNFSATATNGVLEPVLEVIASQTQIDSTLGSELIFDFKVINISQVQQSVFEVRTLNDLPADWASSLCFGNNCFSPTLDSVVTEPPFGEPLNPGDTLQTSVHVFALNNPGTANVEIQVGALSNPTLRTTLNFTATAVVSDIKDVKNVVTEYKLDQNYPNPFNPSTKISFAVPEKSFTTLKVYDMLGSEIAVLVNEEKSAGSYEVLFDASKLSSGVYLYKIQSKDFVQTRKMLLLK